MPSLKDLRNRISSVKATQKITKAMQMVAAAKLRRAQVAADAARPYAERMEAVLANVAAGATGDGPALLTGNGRNDVHLLVVCTAERGLCGGFNTTIVRLARRRIQELLAQGKTVKILCIGKKGRDQLRRDYSRVLGTAFEDVGRRRLAFSEIDAIAVKILAMYEAGEFDVATIVYNRFKSVISQIVTTQQLIPVSLPETTDAPKAGQAMYEYEPDEEEILKALLPRNLSIQLFRALLENAASEQGARMTAMDNATRNAGEMIGKLTIVYNRSRQATITKELIEIISGAEAV